MLIKYKNKKKIEFYKSYISECTIATINLEVFMDQ